jgi:hypothetical protein
MELRSMLVSSKSRDSLFLSSYPLNTQEGLAHEGVELRSLVRKRGGSSQETLGLAQQNAPRRLWCGSRVRKALVIGGVIGALGVGLASLKTSVLLSAVMVLTGEVLFWSPRERRCKLTMQRRRHLSLYLKNVVRLLDQGWDTVAAFRQAVWELPTGPLRTLMAETKITSGDIVEQVVPLCGLPEVLHDRDARVVASAMALAMKCDDSKGHATLKRLSSLLDERCCVFERFMKSCAYIQKISMVCGGFLALFFLLCALTGGAWSEYDLLRLSSTRSEIGIIVSIVATAAVIRIASPLTWGLGDDE